MAQKNNNKDLQSCYFGTTEIEKIFYGTNLVWANNQVIYLGNAQSFNVSSYSGYKSFTADNFYFTTASNVSNTDTVNIAYEGDNQYITLWSGIYKNYNSSTGVLTFRTLLNDAYGNVSAYLVTKPSKLVYLGLGQSFNVKNSYPSKYNRFTANNFLIKTIRHYNSGSSSVSQSYVYHGVRTYPGRWTGRDTFSFTKSYNSSTGQLTVYFNDSGSADGESSDRSPWSQDSSCYVYLNTEV